MALPDIYVHPGSEPAMMNGQSARYSFDGWSATQLDGLCGGVKDEMERVIGLAPKTLVDALGPKVDVPVYVGKGLKNNAAVWLGDANVLNFGGNRSTGQIWPIGFRPPKLRALTIETEPGQDIKEIQWSVGHESLHVLSMYAMQGNFVAPWEAMVARLEKEVAPNARKGLVKAQSWDPARFASTTGLCPPDFARVNYKNVAYEALYLSSYHALDGMRAQQVWDIWSALTEKTLQTGYMPRWTDVETAMKNAGPEGEAALRQPAMQPIKRGVQMMLFPFKNGARTYSFQTLESPNFGAIGANGVRQDLIAELQGLRTGPFRHLLIKRDGRPDEVEGRVTLDQVQDLTFDFLSDKLRQAGRLGEEALRRCGGRMQIEIPGLPIVEIRRS